MDLDLLSAERILKSDSRLHEIYNQKYEISFESALGKHIALNRRLKLFVGVWIENRIRPHEIGLSPSVSIEHYPPNRVRAHLSAQRLTGPYKPKFGVGRSGNDCWYIKVRDEPNFRLLLDAYL